MNALVCCRGRRVWTSTITGGGTKADVQNYRPVPVLCLAGAGSFKTSERIQKPVGRLVISRRPDQAVVINGEIVVRIGEVRGSRVKLVFDLPNGVVLVREEVLERDGDNRVSDGRFGP